MNNCACDDQHNALKPAEKTVVGQPHASTPEDENAHEFHVAQDADQGILHEYMTGKEKKVSRATSAAQEGEGQGQGATKHCNSGPPHETDPDTQPADCPHTTLHEASAASRQNSGEGATSHSPAPDAAAEGSSREAVSESLSDQPFSGRVADAVRSKTRAAARKDALSDTSDNVQKKRARHGTDQPKLVELEQIQNEGAFANGTNLASEYPQKQQNAIPVEEDEAQRDEFQNESLPASRSPRHEVFQNGASESAAAEEVYREETGQNLLPGVAVAQVQGDGGKQTVNSVITSDQNRKAESKSKHPFAVQQPEPRMQAYTRSSRSGHVPEMPAFSRRPYPGGMGGRGWAQDHPRDQFMGRLDSKPYSLISLDKANTTMPPSK